MVACWFKTKTRKYGQKKRKTEFSNVEETQIHTWVYALQPRITILSIDERLCLVHAPCTLSQGRENRVSNRFYQRHIIVRLPSIRTETCRGTRIAKFLQCDRLFLHDLFKKKGSNRLFLPRKRLTATYHYRIQSKTYLKIWRRQVSVLKYSIQSSISKFSEKSKKRDWRHD